MKLLFKSVLLFTAMIVIILQDVAIAENLSISSSNFLKNNLKSTKKISFLKNENQKIAYALGNSIGFYIEHFLNERQKLGIKLDKNKIIAGVRDVLIAKSKLSNQEIKKKLDILENRIVIAVNKKIEKDGQTNLVKGYAYATAFAKKKGVKKTQSGLLYQIEREGTGNIPNNSDTVSVHYKGKLIDGTEFDNSYKRDHPFSFRLDTVIPGWIEGLKHIKKGGKIKLVIPTKLAYGNNIIPAIPVNSTLVFEIELLDIKKAH
ncbi:hypothetical protein HHS_02210 [Candidatus Pantoea carbekii]|uniref:Peptidyl-prolyl cis-trans isomerase n=1 Tax=Candidatus Pantoea carbekii TaxID=1235990 RepID=U3U263_9GAMM|nr:hypothetical protein HHS_02210 [Candidatus Pantoea carbekii]